MSGHVVAWTDVTPPTTASSIAPSPVKTRMSSPLKAEPELPKTGDDELEMQSFIRQAMLSIVRPISEHITEVEAQFQRLQKDILCKMVEFNQNIARFDKQDEQLKVLRRALQEADVRVDGIHKDLYSGLSQARSSAHEAGVVANAAEKQLKVLRSHVQELQDLHAAREPVINSLAEYQGEMLKMLSSHKDLQEEAEALGYNVAGLSQRLEQTKTYHDDTVRSLKDIVAGLAKEKDATQHALKRFAARLDSAVDVELAKFRGDLAAQLKRTTEHEAKISTMTTAISALDEGVMKQAEMLDSQNKSIHKTLKHFDARTAIDLLYKQVRDIYSQLEDLQISSEEDRPVLAELATTVQNNIEENVTKFAGLEEHIQRVETSTQGFDLGLRDIEKKLESRENALDSLEKRAGVVEGLIEHVSTAQRTTSHKVDQNMAELEKTSGRLLQSEELHEERAKDVRSLRAGIEETGEAVKEALDRLDLAHKYLQGVAKGFQQAHQSINDGQEGFPRPQQHHVLQRPVSALPKIPSPSRPQSRGAGVAPDVPVVKS